MTEPTETIIINLQPDQLVKVVLANGDEQVISGEKLGVILECVSQRNLAMIMSLAVGYAMYADVVGGVSEEQRAAFSEMSDNLGRLGVAVFGVPTPPAATAEKDNGASTGATAFIAPQDGNVH